MKKSPPRLINDVRRRRLIVAGAVFATFMGSFFAGLRVLCAFRDANLERAKFIAEQTDLRIAKLSSISPGELSAICFSWTNLVKRTGANLAQSAIASSDIAFLVLTRKPNYRDETQRLFDDYAETSNEFHQCQIKLANLTAKGEDLIETFHESIMGAETNEQCDVMTELCRFKDLMESELKVPRTLIWNGKIDVEAARIDERWKACLAIRGCGDKLDFVENYQSLTNDIYSACIERANLENRMERIAEKLAAIPFDCSNSIPALRTVLEGKIDAVEEEWDKIDPEIDNVVERLALLETQCDEFGKKCTSDLKELHRLHGRYVETDAMKPLQEICAEMNTYEKDIDERVLELSFQVTNEMQRLAGIREEIVSLTNSLAHASEFSDRELEKFCKRGTELAREMDMRIVSDHVSKLLALTDKLAAFFANFKAQFVEDIEKISKSLPDWKSLGNDISSERMGMSVENSQLKHRLAALQENLQSCRGDESALMDLRKGVDEIVAEIGKIDKPCARGVSCINGVSATKELAINAHIKRDIDKLKISLRKIETKTASMLSEGRVYRVKYVQDFMDWGSDIENGQRNFAFALDFPAAGRHRIEIRLSKKRGGYLFRSPGRHDVRISGSLKDDHGRTVFEEVKNDSTAGWGQLGLVAIESLCLSGRNFFDFEINFAAMGARGSSEWRYELLEFEVWIDGKKINSVLREQRL